jgi:hypothetical protein
MEQLCFYAVLDSRERHCKGFIVYNHNLLFIIIVIYLLQFIMIEVHLQPIFLMSKNVFFQNSRKAKMIHIYPFRAALCDLMFELHGDAWLHLKIAATRVNKNDRFSKKALTVITTLQFLLSL